ncbi:PPE family protein [Mycobacterium kansasii]|uniref:PPE family protein n=1 Tax=Mycobacterium kansasii TaxID=1768 RepID=A0A1V3WEE2_MYCKA|nr:PPE family protein [Mycobacterium kansasii]
MHSALLSTGATAAGITAAGTSWTQLSAEYMAALAELEGILAAVESQYQGEAATQFVAAHQPMLLWLADVAAKAAFTAGSHGEIAAAYEGALGAMPTMGELFENHFVHGVLIGTNFMGVNTIPIGLNEADYQRMWQLAADVMSTWDGASTTAVTSIPPTPPSPVTLSVGTGEAGLASAVSAGFSTVGYGTTGGAAAAGADVTTDKLLAGKAASSPASVTDKLPPPQNQTGGNQDGTAEQGLTQNMAGSFLQQAASIGPEAAQGFTQGPGQLLTSAPQQLLSAPQQLSSMLGQFTGGANSLGQQAVPVGFAGTGAIGGFNPAGMTSLAGGAFGSGPSRPLMPSTWGSAPTASSSLANGARAITPVATGLPGAASSSGSGAGGGMMGGGAHNSRGRDKRVNTYADDAVDEDADSEKEAYAMTR